MGQEVIKSVPDFYSKSLKGSSAEHFLTLNEYTRSSKLLNAKLLMKDTNDKDKSILDHMDHLTTVHKLSHPVHLYSGVNFDPGKLTKRSKGVFRSPAFISATHDKHVAKDFADKPHDGDRTSIRHIIHFHIPTGHTIYHASKHSRYPFEHESILPRNTSYKLNQTPDIHQSDSGKTFHIWHAHPIES